VSDWQVGQQVTVHEHWGGPSKILTIKNIGKRYITLSDDSQWLAREGGTRKGQADDWTPSRIRATRPGDDAKIRRRALVRKLEQIRWAGLPLETLDRVAAALEASE
jgi:hypothetical protein